MNYLMGKSTVILNSNQSITPRCWCKWGIKSLHQRPGFAEVSLGLNWKICEGFIKVYVIPPSPRCFLLLPPIIVLIYIRMPHMLQSILSTCRGYVLLRSGFGANYLIDRQGCMLQSFATVLLLFSWNDCCLQQILSYKNI